MDEEYRVEDMSADEIADLLAEDIDDLTEEQAEALRDFVLRIGGIESALEAIEMLAEIERAA